MRKSLIIFALLLAFTTAFVWNRIEAPIAPPPLISARIPPAPPIARPKPPAYRRGERIGEIEIPRLHLKVAVYEGDDAAILDLGAGHVPGTALPDQPGNICIAAHRDKFFRALRFIHENDEIVLDTDRGAEKFLVRSTTIVKPTQTEVLMPAPGRDLTLVTCYPFYYVGSAPKRFIVHALRETQS
jgi:sortase A